MRTLRDTYCPPLYIFMRNSLIMLTICYRFRIFDGYRRDVGRQSTQFIGVICKWLKQISNHLHLISRLQVQTGPLSTQPATDTIAALAYIYPQLKEGVLKGYDSYDDVD